MNARLIAGGRKARQPAPSISKSKDSFIYHKILAEGRHRSVFFITASEREIGLFVAMRGTRAADERVRPDRPEK
jgi:hypothetical protein